MAALNLTGVADAVEATGEGMFGHSVLPPVPVLESLSLKSAVEVTGDGSVVSPFNPLRDKKPSASISFVTADGDRSLPFVHQNLPGLPELLLRSIGSGIAVLDFDNDGWQDLYFGQGMRKHDSPDGQGSANVLVRNVRGQRNRQVDSPETVATSGFSHGVAAGDLNNDGFPDLYVCQFGQDRLFYNNGDGTFLAAAPAELPIAEGWSSSVGFSDLDSDGDVDIFVASYLDADMSDLVECERDKDARCRPNDFPAAADHLFENLGDGRFRDRSELLPPRQGKGLGVATGHFDSDQKPDIFVGNDTTANLLLKNPSASLKSDSGGLNEVALEAGVALGKDGRAQACMGIATSDVNHSGKLDLFVTNYEFEPNSLYVNSGRFFEEAARVFGLASRSWNRMGWGAQFADFNNDSCDDLVVLNSHLYDQPMGVDVYENQAGQRFVNDKEASAAVSTGDLGRSVVVLDWDNNGKMDFSVSNLGGPARLFLNTSVGSRLKALRLIGCQSSRDAQDAVVSAILPTGDSFRVHSPYESGYLSSGTQVLFVPSNCGVDVQWPSGMRTILTADEGTLSEFIVEP